MLSVGQCACFFLEIWIAVEVNTYAEVDVRRLKDVRAKKIVKAASGTRYI